MSDQSPESPYQIIGIKLHGQMKVWGEYASRESALCDWGDREQIAKDADYQYMMLIAVESEYRR